MAGSPKKRARRLAAERAERERRATQITGVSASVAKGIAPLPADGRTPEDRTNRALPFPASANLITGEVLPPMVDVAPEDVTHTARKRAMRRKAAELAEEAIQTLAKGMRSENEKIAQDAADKILKAAGLHDPDKDKLADGLVIQILKMATGDTQ